MQITASETNRINDVESLECEQMGRVHILYGPVPFVLSATQKFDLGNRGGRVGDVVRNRAGSRQHASQSNEISNRRHSSSPVA